MIVSVPITMPSVSSRRVTVMSMPTFWFPTFWTVTSTGTTSPWTAEAGALTLAIAMSVSGPGGAASMLTLKRLSTASMGFASVCVELPAKSRPTGFLLASSVTISDPESPPSLKTPGVTEIWFTKIADLTHQMIQTS